MKKITLLSSTALLASASLCNFAHAQSRAWNFHADHVLGTSLDVTIVADFEDAAISTAHAIQREISRLDGVFSTWREDSELSYVNRRTDVVVSPELFKALEAALRWRDVTGGAFSPVLGEVDGLWKKASLSSGAMDAAKLQRAIWSSRSLPKLDPARFQVRRSGDEQILLDGFAKGLIIDSALNRARDNGAALRGVLINLGGDVRCWGAAPNDSAWRIGLPQHVAPVDNTPIGTILKLNDKAIATSGRGDRDHVVSERRLSHLLDPASGRPVTEIVSATVVANTAGEADALSTAFSVMPIAQSLALSEQLPGVACLLNAANGEQFASRRWSDFAVNNGSRETPRGHYLVQAPSIASWPAGFSLAIQYEIPKAAGTPYRRPYLAIWVTDEKGRIVRTILLFGQRSSWQMSNHQWTRRYVGRQAAMVDSVSRPTRSPGRYTAMWDGLDDNKRPVPQGTYTIHIEAVRQYGDHSYGRTTIDLRSAQTTGAIKADDEFGAVKLSYGPTS